MQGRATFRSEEGPQLLRQATHALRRPAQWGVGIARSRRLHQRVQVRRQSYVLVGRSLASSSRTAGPLWAQRLARLELALHGTLAALCDAGAFEGFLAELRETEWVVYAKRPFGGPEKVLDYLGRYTHRVAISNHRIVSVDGGKVAFRWRDYRHNRRQQTLTLDADEFIRRFLLHTLPTGFHRIRQFGFLANRHRTEKLERARTLLGVAASPPSAEAENADWKDLHQVLTGEDLRLCPKCKVGRMIHRGVLPPEPVQPCEGIDSS